MDIGLPEMDGLSATRELRRRGCPSTIVALTAYATFSDREQCLSAGCDEFLPKPVDIEALVAAIGRARLSG
jgi:CheY-like chemotaxis protein